jgi:hypothetical protein
MSWLWIIIALAAVFLVAAMYYAIRFPSGKTYPTRRAKLLRRIGPLASAVLEDVTVRFYTAVGGVKRVTLAATYRYEVKGSSFTVTLPTDSAKINGPTILKALTVRERVTEKEEREFPERLELTDGTVLDGRERIRTHFLERLRIERPEVKVLFDGKNPALSTVRDWN